MASVSVAANLAKINEKIAASCKRSGRDPWTVNVLAVSKLHSAAMVREAYASGQRDFAENYVQEALAKIEELKDLPDIRWHFIGRIQSNKVKLLNGPFVLVHSLDRLSVARDMGSATRPQNVLLQYNVAAEQSKGGAAADELEKLFHSLRVQDMRNVRVAGLMVMPPLVQKAEEARPFFAEARSMLSRLRAELEPSEKTWHPLAELSMGTSQDYEVAVEEGATWIRVGTELFGPRVAGDRA